MYISKIKLSLENLTIQKRASLIRKIADPYQRHKIIWQLFNTNDLPQKRDFIFHYNEDKHEFYIVSPFKPKKTHWSIIEIKQYDPKLRSNMLLRFKTQVNATIDTKDLFSQKKIRTDVVIHAIKVARHKNQLFSRNELIQSSALNWLKNREKMGGFLVQHAVASSYQQYQLWKSSKRKLSFSTIELEGMIKVTNPNLFKNILFHGLGRKRAFGYGLMFVKKTQPNLREKHKPNKKHKSSSKKIKQLSIFNL